MSLFVRTKALNAINIHFNHKTIHHARLLSNASVLFKRPGEFKNVLNSLDPCRFFNIHNMGRNISCQSNYHLQQNNKLDNDNYHLIYEGPLSRKIKIIKMFSLSTAIVSLFAAPFLILHGKESVPLIGKVILATTVVTMGVTTTLLLHWLTHVYVHKMFFDSQKKIFAAETSNLVGRSTIHKFSVEDIVIPEVESAFSTFNANGRKYFVHMDLKEAEQILKYVRESNLEKLSKQ